MKVAVTTRMYDTGTGRFASELADGFAKAGIDVSLIAPSYVPSSLEPSHSVVRLVTPAGVGARHKSAAMFKKFIRMMSTFKHVLVFSFNKNSAVIFTISEHEIAMIPMMLLLRALRTKVLVIAHDPWPHDIDKSLARSKVRLALIKCTYWISNHIVVLSGDGFKEIVSYYDISPRKITQIPHGAFNIDGVAPMPMRRVLLSFGSIRKNKCVLQLIEAIKICRREGLLVKLLIAGDDRSDDAYIQACRVAMSDDPEAFDLSGFVQEDKLANLISQVDAFVLAYDDFHSQSGVAVMAGLSGRPVISSFAGGIGDLKALGLQGVKISRPINPESIAEAIKEFFSEPAEKWKMKSMEGAGRLQTALDWKNIANKYIDVLTWTESAH